MMIDLDLEKFFDQVNHDILMGLVAKQVADKRLLKLIRGFLAAGVMEGGLVSPTVKGSPQGGPLSPLLSECSDNSGEITPPCGVPVPVRLKLPSSSIPALSRLSIIPINSFQLSRKDNLLI